MSDKYVRKKCCETSNALKPLYLKHVDKGFLKIYLLK